MLYFTIPLNGLLMIVLPIALGVTLHRGLGVRGSLFGWGTLTFVASQVVHIPLLIGLTYAFQQQWLPNPPQEWTLPFNAITLGLLAGLCEEVARWLFYRYVITNARTWREALMFGAGHGGIEAILLGVVVFITFAQMYTLQSNPSLINTFPVTAQETARQQLVAYWSQPDFAPLLGALERVFALCLHLAMSALVLQALTRRKVLFLVAAILWHAAVDGIAVFALPTWGPAITEAIIAVSAVAALALISALRPVNTPQPKPV